MSIRRYAVIDDDGTVLNITIAEEGTADWPGYGTKLVDIGEEPPEEVPVAQRGKPDNFEIVVLKDAVALGINDRIDLKTGAVTKSADLEVAIAIDVVDEQVKP